MGRRRLTLALLPLLVGCGPSGTTEAAPQGPGEEGSGWTRLPDPPLTDGALLDLATGEWHPIADAPYGVRDAQTALVGGDVYLLSGCRGGPSCFGPPALLRYDVDADRWDEPADPPRGLRYAELVPLDGRLLALATTDEHGERADALYDPASDSWSELPDDPLAAAYDRHAVVDGNRLLVFGSTIDEAGERDVKIGAALDLGAMTWSRLPDAPGPGYQVWRVGDEAWLNPHYGDGGGVLDLATDTWRGFPEDPVGPDWRDDLAGVVGRDEAVYEYSSGWVRDTRKDRWVHVPSRPEAGYDESLVAVGESLVVFGGQRWEEQEGELLADTWVWRPTT